MQRKECTNLFLKFKQVDIIKRNGETLTGYKLGSRINIYAYTGDKIGIISCIVCDKLWTRSSGDLDLMCHNCQREVCRLLPITNHHKLSKYGGRPVLGVVDKDLDITYEDETLIVFNNGALIIGDDVFRDVREVTAINKELDMDCSPLTKVDKNCWYLNPGEYVMCDKSPTGVIVKKAIGIPMKFNCSHTHSWKHYNVIYCNDENECTSYKAYLQSLGNNLVYGDGGHCVVGNKRIIKGKKCCESYMLGKQIAQDFINKCKRLDKRTTVICLEFNHVLSQKPRIGIISAGLISYEFDKYLYVYGLITSITALKRCVNGLANYSEILKCHEFIGKYIHIYDNECMMAKIIGNRLFSPLQVEIGSNISDYLDCEPIIYYQSSDAIVLRSSTGYQVYGLIDDSVMNFVKDTPYQRKINYNIRTGIVECDMSTFLKDVSGDLMLLKDIQTYYKLQFCISQGYEVKVCKSLLNLSHYYIYGERSATQCVVLQGRPGIGKSHVITETVKGHDVYYYRHDPKTKNFFSGYYGQDIVVIDDLGHYSPQEWLILKDLITTTPTMLPMADIKYIGKIPFVSKVIYITTNCLHQIFEFRVETREAIMRRINVITLGIEKCEYQTYSRSTNLMNTILKGSKDMVSFLLKIYMPLEYSITYSTSMMGKIDKIFDIVLRLPLPYVSAIRYIYENLRVMYVNVSEVVNTCYREKWFDMMYSARVNYIPRECRKSFYKLSKELQCIVYRSLRFVYRAWNPLVDSTSVKDTIARAEGNILSNDVINENDSILLCGKIRDCPDLTPYLRKVELVKKCSGFEDSGCIAKDFIDMFGIDWCDENGNYHIKVEPSEIKTYGYVLENLPESLKDIYTENVFFEQFAPLSDKISTVIDERQWKPTALLHRKVNKSALNKLFQQQDKSKKSKTLKRRDERKRQSIRHRI